MSDWTAGYITEIAYTHGYYKELNPLRIRLGLLNASLMPPDTGNHCELGYGQGISVNIHAAASNTTWHGSDFNPAHAIFAQTLAHASGADAHLTDEAFLDFCNRSDLPDFDSIGLHGIWNWISDENRMLIVDFISRKLKAGGVLYISYNTQPGMAAMLPLRELWVEHTEIMSTRGEGCASRIDSAMHFTEKLFATNPIYAKLNPTVVENFIRIQKQNSYYLAHEYFNQNWLSTSFSTMLKCLTQAKISYACSALYREDIDVMNLTTEQQAFLSEIPDAMFRQTVRDFCVNRSFRRDYWVKGERKLTKHEQITALREESIILVTPRIDVQLKVKSNVSEVNLHGAIYNPILDVLADHKIKTLGQIEQLVKDHGVSFTQLHQAIMVLASLDHLEAVQHESIISQAKKQTDKLNTYLIDKAIGNSEINNLASPVTGGGVDVSRFQQLFLLAIRQGKKDPVEWAEFVWHLLVSQGQKLVKKGEILTTNEQNLAELTEQARAFSEKRLPILKALKII